MAKGFKTWVCDRSLAGIVRSNPAGGVDVSCECCVLLDRGLCVGLISRPESPTGCGVSEFDRETSIMRRPWPTSGCSVLKSGQLPSIEYRS